MEICDESEIWVKKDDDFVFGHTKVILRDADDEYFYAKTEKRAGDVSLADIDESGLSKIPADQIWPLANAEFTRAPDPLPSTSYFKRPELVDYGLTNFDCGSDILAEVEACEVLRRHPHPNIAPYLGCVVKDGRIRGLVFPKYSTTLTEVLRQGNSFDRGRCLRGIEAGVLHMHATGLVHNDLSPDNIMMDGDDPVIIDFDTCKREGDKLGSKLGSHEWSPEDQEYAVRENDLYNLSKIEEALTAREIDMAC